MKMRQVVCTAVAAILILGIAPKAFGQGGYEEYTNEEKWKEAPGVVRHMGFCERLIGPNEESQKAIMEMINEYISFVNDANKSAGKEPLPYSKVEDIGLNSKELRTCCNNKYYEYLDGFVSALGAGGVRILNSSEESIRSMIDQELLIYFASHVGECKKPIQPLKFECMPKPTNCRPVWICDGGADMPTIGVQMGKYFWGPTAPPPADTGNRTKP